MLTEFARAVLAGAVVGPLLLLLHVARLVLLLLRLAPVTVDDETPADATPALVPVDRE